MADYIVVNFEENGVLQTGLEPTITIYTVSGGSAVVSAAAMTEIGSTGVYQYLFSTRDVAVDYVFVCDGTDSLDDHNRYKTGIVPADNADLLFINNIESGAWHRTGTQMIFYKSDNVTEVARFNLYKIDGSLASETEEVFKRVRV